MRENLCGELALSKMNHLSQFLKNNPNLIAEAKSRIKEVDDELNESAQEVEKQQLERLSRKRKQNMLVAKSKEFLWNLVKTNDMFSTITFSKITDKQFKNDLLALIPPEMEKIVKTQYLHMLVEHFTQQEFNGTNYAASETLQQILD